MTSYNFPRIRLILFHWFSKKTITFPLLKFYIIIPCKTALSLSSWETKNTTLHLTRLDNNWRSGCVATSRRECGNQKLSRWRANVTLQLFWVRFLWSFYYFVWNANSQNARHTHIPMQVEKQNWKPTTGEFIACHFDWTYSLAAASHLYSLWIIRGCLCLMGITHILTR